MTRDVVCYRFASEVPLPEIEGTLLLAVLAVAALVGEAAVQIDGRYTLDPEQGVCLIDAGTETGRSIAKVFTGLANQEFGSSAFVVERVVAPVSSPAA